jgi:hypothetical protein
MGFDDTRSDIGIQMDEHLIGKPSNIVTSLGISIEAPELSQAATYLKGPGEEHAKSRFAYYSIQHFKL